ncbi:MAG: hypothetical protein ABIO70_24790 [Pseudomonadota bacterium]
MRGSKVRMGGSATQVGRGEHGIGGAGTQARGASRRVDLQEGERWLLCQDRSGAWALWSTEDGTRRRRVGALVAAPEPALDGDVFLLADDGGGLRLVDAESGATRLDVAVSARGHTLTAEERTLLLVEGEGLAAVDLASGVRRALGTVRGHGKVTLRADPDGRWALLTGPGHSELRRLEDGAPICAPAVSWLAWHPRQDMAAGVRDGRAVLLDLGDQCAERPLADSGERLLYVSFDSEGHPVGQLRHTSVRWDPKTGAIVARGGGAAPFAPRRAEAKVRLEPGPAGTQRLLRPGHAEALTLLDFGPDGWVSWEGETIQGADPSGRLMLRSSADGSLRPMPGAAPPTWVPLAAHTPFPPKAWEEPVAEAAAGCGAVPGAPRGWLAGLALLGAWRRRSSVTNRRMPAPIGLINGLLLGSLALCAPPAQAEVPLAGFRDAPVAMPGGFVRITLPDVRAPGARVRRHALAWSPDSELLAVGIDDGGVVLLQAATWRQVARLEGLTEAPRALLFDDRGALAALDSEVLCVWREAEGWAPRCHAHAENHPGGLRLDSGGGFAVGRSLSSQAPGPREVARRGDDLVLLDSATGALLRHLGAAGDPSVDTALSPDGRWLAVRGRDWDLRVADLTPAAAFELAPGVALVQAAAFAGGALWVHTWRAAERWELESGRRTAVLEDVDLLAPCDGSGDTVALVQGGRLVTLRDGEEVRTIPLEGPLTALACAQDGARMAGAGREGGVTLWDEGIARPGPDIAALEALETTQRRRQKKSTAADDGRGGPAEGRAALRVRTLALSPDGGRLLLTLDDQSARTWDLATGQPELSLAAAQGRAVEAAFEAGSDAILVLEATAGKLRRLRPGAARPERVGDPGAGYAALKMAFHARSLGRDPPPAQRVGWHTPVLAVRPDGRLLAAADPEGGIGVWDTLTGERLRSLAGPLTQEGITLSGDGRWLLATTPGGRRWLWDLETATLRWTRAALADRVAFLPGEAGLVVAIQGALARIDLDGTVTDLPDDPEAGCWWMWRAAACRTPWRARPTPRDAWSSRPTATAWWASRRATCCAGPYRRAPSSSGRSRGSRRIATSTRAARPCAHPRAPGPWPPSARNTPSGGWSPSPPWAATGPPSPRAAMCWRCTAPGAVCRCCAIRREGPRASSWPCPPATGSRWAPTAAWAAATASSGCDGAPRRTGGRNPPCRAKNPCRSSPPGGCPGGHPTRCRGPPTAAPAAARQRGC